MKVQKMKTKHSTEADYEAISNANNLYVGMLSDDETESLNRLIADGLAEKYYHSAAAAMMGLPKFRMKT